MKLHHVLTMSLICLTLVIYGCGGNEKTASPKAQDISTAEAQTTVAQPAAPQTPQTLETPNAIAGSIWKVGEFEIQFRDNARILVKGGELGKLNPSGVEGKYTLKDGTIEISVMGQSRKGTFDNQVLIMEGAVGEKVK